MFKNRINAVRSAIATGALVLAGQASAAVPTEVSTSLTTAAVDVATIAGLALLVYLAPKVFKYMRGGI